jgi:hypothetical protein
MASITREIMIDAPPDDVWDALRDFGALHQRLVPGFVTDCHLERDIRTITFFNGAVAREMLVAVDNDTRRLVYSVVDSALQSTHDNSSAQVFTEAEGSSRFVWIKDVLPDEIAGPIGQLMQRGIGVIKETLESEAARAARLASAKTGSDRPSDWL